MSVLALGHFCESHGPCVVLNTKMYVEEPQQGQHNLSVASCDACQSLQVDQALISRDCGLNYITTRTALEQDTAFLLKHATVRSLSCEAEATLYFGDQDRGHVFSHSFTVHDSLARGFQRKYAILMLTHEKIQLLNNWTVLTKYVKEIAKYLQDCSTQVNDMEQTQKPQRAVRQAQSTPSNNSGRSLAQLTGRPAIYAHLHLWFTWLLGCAMVVKEPSLSLTLPLPKPSCLLRTIQQDMGQATFRIVSSALLCGFKIISNDCYLINALNSLLPNENWTHGEHQCELFRDLDGKWSVTTASKIPTQLSTYQNDTDRALHNLKINEAALEPHLTSLCMQWLQSTRVLCWCPQIDLGLLLSLNVQKNDLDLLIYWSSQCIDGVKHKSIVRTLNELLL